MKRLLLCFLLASPAFAFADVNLSPLASMAVEPSVSFEVPLSVDVSGEIAQWSDLPMVRPYVPRRTSAATVTIDPLAHTVTVAPELPVAPAPVASATIDTAAPAFFAAAEYDAQILRDAGAKFFPAEPKAWSVLYMTRQRIREKERRFGAAAARADWVRWHKNAAAAAANEQWRKEQGL